MDLLSGSGVLAERHEDFQHLATALAVSRDYGGRAALMVKTTRTNMTKEEKLRTRLTHRVETAIYAAIDQSGKWPGHTPLLVLLHNLHDRKVPVKNPVFYIIGEVSEADLGIFVLQVRVDEPKIVCWHQGVATCYEPTRANRKQVKWVQPLAKLDPPLIYTLDLPPVSGVSLYPVLAPSGTRHNTSLRYDDLREDLQEIFDLMFLSLCGGLITQQPKSDQNAFRDGPGIGAVIVNEHGQILSYGVDQPGSALLHAETITIKSLQGAFGGSLNLSNCRLYTSLEPCVMCSGFVYEACVKHFPNFKVVYHQWDPAVHKSKFKGQEATGITTILQEKNAYHRCDHALGAKLQEKMQQMSKLHQAQPNILIDYYPKEQTNQEGYKKKFDNSATEALKVLSFRRRFAKLKLRLLAMPELITARCGEDKLARDFLLDTWLNVLKFLEVDCGQNVFAEMELIAAFLDDTRNKNLLTGPKTKIHKETFGEFFKRYMKDIQVYLERD